MAYKTQDLFNTATEQIKLNRLIFIEDIIAYLPCSKPTFYEHFPNESDLYKKLVELLDKNKVELKVSMRSKWYKSNSPALQLGLMKLLGTPEELRKLSMTHQAVEKFETPIFNGLDLDVTEDNSTD
jgi:AcrR family transcriptional regulator